MGEGARLRCSKCHKDYSVAWGSGFAYPMVYEKTMKAARSGKYGPEWQTITTTEEFVVIDAEDYVYECPKCGYWCAETDLSLYVPKDPQELVEKYNLDSVHELVEREYAMAWQIEEEYKLYKKRIHICAKCGCEMSILTSDKRYSLPCPYCGGEPEEGGIQNMIQWD